MFSANTTIDFSSAMYALLVVGEMESGVLNIIRNARFFLYIINAITYDTYKNVSLYSLHNNNTDVQGYIAQKRRLWLSGHFS